MKEFKYIITDPEGIHARPAGQLVAEAKKFSSKIELKKDEKIGDLKKIFSVMGLGVKNGQEITVTFSGDDEEQAYETISQFMQDNL
ncbi:HPr family phosphocarrier protein [Lachnospiraceae bacterium OttesenSCG-928-E19]|nr:HPr family phosphocarrier protein [Lachnospiraceae bacterium OttesenSCG-928-E19]